jgi:hypothetical protein
MEAQQAMPVGGPLRRRINRLAHTIAQRAESRLRAGMLATLSEAREAGADHTELAALVASMEARHVGQ